MSIQDETDQTMKNMEQLTVESKVNLPELKPAFSESDFDIHNNALEWSLADPIVMDSAEDIKSTINWQDRVQPFHHQINNLMTFCRKLPVSLIADDVGLGKTVSAGLILSELMVRNRVSRALVICPSLLGPQWIEELNSKFGISGRWATGKDLDQELRGVYPVVATTYHTASSRLEQIRPGAFDMLILDEAHKVRNLYGGQTKPKFAKNIRESLKNRLFRYVVMLTATPIQNRLWDLYSLIDCLAVAKGHENPFGNETQFKNRYIADSKASARELNRYHAVQFRNILRQYLVRTRRQDVKLLFPDRKVKLFRVKKNELDQKLENLVANNIDGINGLLRTSLLIAMMSSPQALSAQLRNMSLKNANWNHLANDVEKLVSSSGYPSKLLGLLKIIAELRKRNPQNWRLVVFTTRKETQKLIISVLKDEAIPYGIIQGGKPDANFKAVKNYSADPPLINVIVSTDAGAEGVNLQSGNVVVNYDLPWNPMILEQRIGRVQRLASRHAHVVILNLAVDGSPEEKVVSRLMAKLLTVSHTVGDVETILEASGNDDGGASFEGMIQDLVVKSLKGQNTDRATELATQSIEEAKELFESQREEIDAKLGDLSELHSSGPSMPRLESIKPSIQYQEFVQKALIEEGYEVLSESNDLLTVKKSGAATENIVFTNTAWQKYSQPGYFHGRSPKLYMPGKPDFERLVQRWLDRGQLLTRDLTEETEALIKKQAEAWLRNIEGSTFEKVIILKTRQKWQGSTKFKATAMNAVDSYETLVDVKHTPETHTSIDEETKFYGSLIKRKLEPNEHHPDLSFDGKNVLTGNTGISDFSKFYSERLTEELEKSHHDNAQENKIINDLNPSIYGDAVSQQGFLYHECDIEISYSFDGKGTYSASLTACPATNQIFSEPSLDQTCEETGKIVHMECLEKCERSGKRVLKHLLVQSEMSGRRALAEFSCICQLTGSVLLDDEELTSVVSGKKGVASSFRFSPISNRPALPEEFVECAFTGIEILPDEINISEISQQAYRADEKETSAISGISGHKSEFKQCAITKDYILESEAIKSDVSGLFSKVDQSVTSDAPPFRSGTIQEAATCSETGKQLLIDEIEKCQITDQLVDKALLAKSDLSQKYGIRTKMICCEVTQDLLLPNETATSTQSGKRVRTDLLKRSEISGKLALPEEMQQCELTGSWAFPEELVVSQLSSKFFRNDQTETSDVSGRIAHQSETVICNQSHVRLLKDETGVSAISGKVVDQRLLVTSALSGTLALPHEMEQCEFTDSHVLPEEIIQSDLSGKSLRKDHAITSEVSGRHGHLSESIQCQHSQKIVLQDETVTSEVSGKVIAKEHALQSPVSNSWALPEEFTICEITGTQVLEQELITSDESGRKFRKDECIMSSDSNRVFHSSECVVCEWTGDLIPECETDISDVSGKRIKASLLQTSPKSSRKGTPAEFDTCEFSEARLLEDELTRSELSGKTVDKDLLEYSEKSNTSAAKPELITCMVSGKRLLPTEVDFSEELQGFVDVDLLEKSQVSGKLVLKANLISCTLTEIKGLPSELVKCEVSGKYVIPEKSNTCEVTDKLVRSDLLVQSFLSGRYLLPKAARKSMHHKQYMCPDEAGFCHWNSGYLPHADLGICKRTGLSFSSRGLSKKTGELVIFSKLKNNEELDSFEELLPWIQQQENGNLKSVVSLRGIKNPKQNFCLIQAQVSRMLGMMNSNLYFLLKLTPTPQIIGKITTEANGNPGWKEIS